jgi:HK97 family phage major capsid protein
MSLNPLDYVLKQMEELKPTIDELAAFEGRFSDDQQRSWDATNAKWDELDERRKELEERARRSASVSGMTFTINRDPDPFKAELRNVTRSDALGMGRTAVERMSSKFVSDESADQVTKLMDRGGSVGETAARLAVTTGSDEYREAFWAYMTGSASANHAILQRANDEYRAMTAGTGNSGGFMVPLYMDPSFSITGTGAYNPIRDVANVKQITTLTYNGSNAAQVTAAILGENVPYTDNAPVVAQIQLPTYKYGAYIPASFEAFEDIDTLAVDVGELFADAKNNLEATQFETGSGTAPHGVVTDVTAITASRVTPTTGGAFVVADLYKVHSALPPRYRRTSGRTRAWQMSVNIIDTIRQFATANNYHAYLATLAQGQPPVLLDDTLIEASTMSTTITTGQNILLFGDFNQFQIVDRVGVSVEFIPNVFDQATGRPSGTRAWLMHWRFGSGVRDANAFRVLLL